MSSETPNKKCLLTVLLGNALEFYDLGLYGFFAPTISAFFFPSHDKFILTIASMSVFAAGFIMRPFGALFFGHIGDFLGRKLSISSTILIMAIATFLIGIIPTYETIGILAPLGLILCRLTQGICTGGEYNNAAILTLEHVAPTKRGLYSGYMTASSILGFFLASSISSIMFILPSTPVWFWRVPFLIGAIIGFIGFYLRRNYIKESPVFQKKKTYSPFFMQAKLNIKNIITTLCVGWFAGVLSLSLIGYIPTYLNSVTKLLPNQIALVSNLGIFVYMIFLPVMGYLADKFGIERIMKISAVLTLIGAYSIFTLLSSGELPKVIAGELSLSLLAALFLGPMHAYILSLFPVEFRCRGISFSFALGVGIFGGVGPLVSTFLIENLTFPQAPALYFIASAITWISVVHLFKANNRTRPVLERPSLSNLSLKT